MTIHTSIYYKKKKMVTSIETIKYFRKSRKAFHKTQHTREKGMQPDEW